MEQLIKKSLIGIRDFFYLLSGDIENQTDFLASSGLQFYGLALSKTLTFAATFALYSSEASL